MPCGTKMYRQIAKKLHEMGLCAKNDKNIPGSLFLDINGLTLVQEQLFLSQNNFFSEKSQPDVL